MRERFFYGFSQKAGDGSGYSIVVSGNQQTGGFGPVTLYGRDGKVYAAPLNSNAGTGNFADRNGNEITVNGSGGFYDTLSGTTASLTVSQGAPPTSTTFSYTAPSTGTASYTMKYGSYTVQTNFGCSGINHMGATQEYLVSEIDLPDNTKYIFTYEPTYQHSGSVTGRMASVTLPTGGASLILMELAERMGLNAPTEAPRP